VEELRDATNAAPTARWRAERKARRAAGLPTHQVRETTFELGRQVSGDRLLGVRRARVLMPLARLARTMVAFGAPGSGKTMTLSRLAYGVAPTSDWQVVMDAKGDPTRRRDSRRRCAPLAVASRCFRMSPTTLGAATVARSLQEWMGHRDYKTTLIYADYAPIAHERELVERAFGAPGSAGARSADPAGLIGVRGVPGQASEAQGER
jgi:hypothetical protein